MAPTKPMSASTKNMLKGGYWVAKKGYQILKNEMEANRRARKITMPFQTPISRYRTSRAAKKAKLASTSMKFRTRGYSGKKFPRGKKNIVDTFAKYGSVVKLERGDTATDGQAVYVGVHTAPLKEVAWGVSRALLKELFRQGGVTIVDWNETIPYPTSTPLTLEIHYFASKTTGTRSTYLVGFGADTFKIASEAIYTAVVAINNANSTSVIFDKVVMRQRTTADASILYPPLASVDLNFFNVHIAGYSTLSVQNITVAGNVNADAGGDEDDAANIENNPLKGKVYYTKGNGFIPLKRSHDDVSFTPFIADAIHGEMENLSANSYPSITEKPPNAKYFKNTKANNVLLQPGQIRNLTTKSFDKYSWNYFWDTFKRYITAIATTDYHPIGASAMIGLEKQLDSRTTGPSVNVSWELNTTIKVKSVYRARIESLPLLKIE